MGCLHYCSVPLQPSLRGVCDICVCADSASVSMPLVH